MISNTHSAERLEITVKYDSLFGVNDTLLIRKTYYVNGSILNMTFSCGQEQPGGYRALRDT